MTNIPAHPSQHLQHREAIKRWALPACAIAFLVATAATMLVKPSIAVVLAYGLDGAVMFFYWHFAESRPNTSLVFGALSFVSIGVFSTKLQFGSFGEHLVISIPAMLSAFFALVETERRLRVLQPQSNGASSGTAETNGPERNEA